VRYEHLLLKEQQIEEETHRLNHTLIGATLDVQELLEKNNSNILKTGTTLGELIRRPELSYEQIGPIDKNRSPLPKDVIEQVNINIKYEGYIQRQLHQVQQFKKLESKIIPKELDYTNVPSLRIEAKQKLMQIKPMSVGQASRISGVSPADISVLLIYLEHYNRSNKINSQ